MLEVEGLEVEVEGRQIIKNVSLSIEEGETHVLFGPNGSGKTTLLLTLMGFPRYKVTGGKIFFKGEDITHLSTTARVKLGMGIAFQRPPILRGVKLADMLNICMGRKMDELVPEQLKLAERLNLAGFLSS